MRLRVLTWNVFNDQGDPRRTGLLNAELRRLAPDLVALQEVCHPDRSDQLAALTAGTGLDHTTHQAGLLRNLPPAFLHDGTAVATRWPHRVLGIVEHPVDPAGIHWWTLAISVTTPDLGELLFIVPTTAWRLDAEAARERQAVDITDLDGRHRTRLPTIVAGDFNATPGSASIRYLSGLQSIGGRSAHYHDVWTVAGDGPGHTWSVDNPLAAAEIDRLVRQPGHRRRIDYVFVGSAHCHPTARAHVDAVHLVGDRPVDGIWLSDHAGIVVDLDVTLETSPGDGLAVGVEEAAGGAAGG
ncbi:endonuclease/exonuclease/phosphatase family protein [Actinophytocola sp.]|uniref:endonuclease/exonuclease/phosphatase family protein n=1 Tax=Actinophytocola sp. TaxID=1872138 RepID=UPI002D7E21E0|nr:endonuclease/exonuclease/phosphatase family protein [Actinophytocola sp.]HET9139221.1 endonuclease/exonuclease/phosphatase family protein [Actinophytocola sp.]